MKIESGKSQVLFALMPALLFVAVSGLRVRSVFFFVKHRVRVVLLVPTFVLSQLLDLVNSFFEAVCPCVVYQLPWSRYVELLETPLCIGKFHCVVLFGYGAIVARCFLSAFVDFVPRVI